jgi:hypothetical protein
MFNLFSGSKRAPVKAQADISKPVQAEPFQQDLVSTVVAGLRAGAAKEREDLAAREAQEKADQDRLWNGLLTVLEQQYGIPSEAVKPLAKQSRWIITGFYEGPISVCGVPFEVEGQAIPTIEDNGTRGFSRYRAVLSRKVGMKTVVLTADDVAEIIEKAAA